jgi:hypothetical protein
MRIFEHGRGSAAALEARLGIIGESMHGLGRLPLDMIQTRVFSLLHFQPLPVAAAVTRP